MKIDWCDATLYGLNDQLRNAERLVYCTLTDTFYAQTQCRRRKILEGQAYRRLAQTAVIVIGEKTHG